MNLASQSKRMPSEPRRSTSLTLRRQLLDEARELGVNVSRAAEDGIARAVSAERARRWQEETAAEMEAYNRFIDAGGVPLSEFRKF